MGLLSAIQDEQFWRDVAKNGRGLLQGASNAVASNITGPVDLINAGMGLLGLPVSREPVGGEAWARKKGLTAAAPGAAGLAGETLGLVGPMVVAGKAPQVAAGLLKMADNAMAQSAANQAARNQLGAIVYHGSPHKFDRFDASKIGTGEGAQAYGHGLYLAENPSVAKQYADTLTDKAPKFLDGVPADQLSTAQKSALGMLADAGGNANAALLAAKTDMARAGGAGADFHVERYNTLRDIARGKSNAVVGEPSLYKVDLPDNAIARMLDWDKPLSQQAHVMDLIKKQESARTQSVLDQRLQTLANVGEDAPNAATLKRQIELLREEVANPQSGVGSMTGGEYYNYLRRRDMPPSKQSDMFRNAGIPGIRYLDGGSRGAGAGTSNYVVFPGEESLLKILERNGVAP